MRSMLTTILLFIGWLASTNTQAQPTAPPGTSRWEADIRVFEKQDELHHPMKQGVLFVGSSSIKRWDLDKSFPDLMAINRGFGGSQLADSIAFADRLIVKHEPRLVVIYAGDNDLAAGKSVEQVRDDFQTLVNKIHTPLPQTKVVYLGIKPSIKRWNLIDQVREANRLIRDITDRDERLEFIDTDQPMLGDDGQPRAELFVADGLHLSERGYALWASLLQPHLRTTPYSR